MKRFSRSPLLPCLLLLLLAVPSAWCASDNDTIRSVTAGATISGAGLRLTLSTPRQVTAAGTINGVAYAAIYEATCAAAGTTDADIGTSIAACNQYQKCPVCLPITGAIRVMQANGPIAINSTVYPAAAGQVTTTVTTAQAIGIALTQAGTTGDLLEVIRTAAVPGTSGTGQITGTFIGSQGAVYSAAGTCNGSAQAYTHGLGSTPSFYIVSPSNLSLAGTNWSISTAVGATAITVTGTNNLGITINALK